MTRLSDWLVSFAFSAGIVLSLSPTRVDAAQGQRPAARASARTNVNAPHSRPAVSSRSAANTAAAAGTRAQIGGSAARDRAATVNRNSTSNVNRDINRDHNVNINQNVNVNHDINVNHDVEVHHYDHDHWDDWDDSDGWDDHPFAAAAAITTGVAVTSAIIGSIVHTVPPSCVQVIVNNTAYQQCGSTWYLPQYSGTTVQYVVVAPPR